MSNTFLVFISFLVIIETLANEQTNANCCTCDKVLGTFQNMFLHDRDHKYEKSQNNFVAFSSSLGRNFVADSDTKVIFDQIQTNIGNHYNTGVFTAPRDGVYYFDWTILGMHGKNGDSFLVVNGTIQRKNACNSHSDGGSFGYRAGSASVVLQLKKNEQVWVQLRFRGGFAHGDSWSSFQGWLLAEM